MFEALKRIADAPTRLDAVNERLVIMEGWIANNGGLDTALQGDVLTLRGEVAALRTQLDQVIGVLTGTVTNV